MEDQRLRDKDLVIKMIGGRFKGGWEARVLRPGAHDICAQNYDVPIRHQEGPHNQSDGAGSLKKKNAPRRLACWHNAELDPAVKYSGAGEL